MFQEFLRRRSRGDALDLPDWVGMIYMLGSTTASILMTVYLIDSLPFKVAPQSLMASLLAGFLGLGVFLHEWVLKAPLKRIIPILLFIATLSLGLLFTPLFLFGLIWFPVVGYQRFRLWRTAKRTVPPSAP